MTDEENGDHSGDHGVVSHSSLTLLRLFGPVDGTSQVWAV